MHHSILKQNKHFLIHLGCLTALVSIVGASFVQSSFNAQLSMQRFPTNEVVQAPTLMSFYAGSTVVRKMSDKDKFIDRVARRLQNRLVSSGRTAPAFSSIKNGVEERLGLLKKSITLDMANVDLDIPSQVLSVAGHPLWIQTEFSKKGMEVSLSEQEIQKTLDDVVFADVTRPTDITITDIELHSSFSKANTTGIATSGYDVQSLEMSQSIAKALVSNEQSVPYSGAYRPGKVTNTTGMAMGDLNLLATGRSNFKWSSWGRAKNVRKGLNEHVHNVLVAPGEIFSFNDTLDGPVNLSNGWAMAKVIYNGDELRPAPGGGICQVSTTTFRAIVEAGFPLVDRRSHSLYVSYYEEYGIGLDATIYPGQQDLQFVNNTAGYLLIQAYSDELDDAYVNIYGTSDNRAVALEGPFFSKNAPDDFEYNGRGLSKNEIGWRQKILWPDGRNEENIFVSRYKTIPSYITAKYGQSALHAVAE